MTNIPHERNILVVAPHCDDEVLGCGGVMARESDQGHRVYVAIVTNGHLGAPELFAKKTTQMVRSEALEAHSILGVQETFFLDFPAPRLDSIPSYKISLALENIIRDKKIDTLYIPHRGDLHKDHSIVFETCLVAGRPINGCSVKNIYAYETLSETEWGSPVGGDAFVPTVFVDIESVIKTKLEAFKCFSTQIKDPPHPRSLQGIENLSMFRGNSAGLKNVEAFALIREIR